jgi:hypothetical protein
LTFDNTDGALSAPLCVRRRANQQQLARREQKPAARCHEPAQCFFVRSLLYDIIIHRYMKGRNNKTFGSQRSRAVNVTSIGKYRHYIIHTQTFDINYVSRAYKHHGRTSLWLGSLHVSNITGEKRELQSI